MGTLLALPGGPEIIVILLIIVFLFGGKKIPELMKGIGNGIREFKKGKEGVDDVSKDVTKQINP